MTKPLSSFTLDQVQVFLTVVDAGSFTRAAKRLNRAQSAVSYAISNLERLLDVPLFEREGGQVTMTAAAQTLLPTARGLVERAVRLQEEARAIHDGAEAALRVAVDGLVPPRILTDAVRCILRDFPQAEISVRTEALGAVPLLLMQRRVDIGISPHLSEHSREFEHRPLTKIEMICVATPEVQAHTHPQIVIRDRTQLTQSISYAVVGRSLLHVADAQTKQDFLLQGLGWGMFPSEFIANAIDAGRLVELDDPAVPPRTEVTHYIGWRRDTPLGTTGRAFVQAALGASARATRQGQAVSR